MIRMTKQTDYGFILLSRLAEQPQRVAAAPELAAETRLPLPMVSKILKILVRRGLLTLPSDGEPVAQNRSAAVG